MLAPELRTKVDALWDKFWAGGLANPLMAIDQMNYLIFLRRLEYIDDRKASRLRAQGEEPQSVFDGFEECRWSYWKNLGAEEMHVHVQSVVFPWLKALPPESYAFVSFMGDATFLIPKASLLVEAVRVIDDLAITERNVDTQGDIYEYMLSHLNVAGQIGQFRTPRHIMRTMVRMINPKIGETVMDPACGTGGFLIAAAQHMIAAGTSEEFLTFDEQGAPHGMVGDRLSDEQWVWLRESAFAGSDFDHTMVRIAAMNMMLHGIENPRLAFADALGKSFSHAPRTHLVLANPPFSGAVSTADISDDFGVRTGKTELLFLQLVRDILLSGGRAAVIVPEGVVLGTDRASVTVRRSLLEENNLEAVIALPYFAFKPYASVATCILLFRRGGQTERTWMYRVEEDGYSHGDERRSVDKDDLPDLLEQWGKRNNPDYVPSLGKHGWVNAERVASTGFEISPRVQLRQQAINHSFDTKTLKELCDITRGSSSATTTPPGEYPLVTTAADHKTSAAYDYDGEAVCIPLASSTGHGHASIKRLSYMNGKFAAASIVAVLQVKDPSVVLPRFIYYFLEAYKEELLVSLMRGAANVSLNPTKIGTVEVPVPPLKVQREFITSLEEIDERVDKTRQRLALLQDEKQLALNELRDHFSEPPDLDSMDEQKDTRNGSSSATAAAQQLQLPHP